MKRNLAMQYGLTKDQIILFSKLSSPKKIQDFLDTLPINAEEKGETYMSVSRTLKVKEAHCLEGALVAALALWLHGEKPLLMDLKAYNGDDHIIALYKQNGFWGGISKTNHATLRFRDPIYKTVRELALSYFHEYIHLKTGEKILRSFSEPYDLREVLVPIRKKNKVIGYKTKTESIQDWILGNEELFWLAEAIDNSPHEDLVPKKNIKLLRNADPMELRAGNILEW